MFGVGSFIEKSPHAFVDRKSFVFMRLYIFPNLCTCVDPFLWWHNFQMLASLPSRSLKIPNHHKLKLNMCQISLVYK